ncbi:manganese/zinc/iron transport system ATP- binding protein [Sinobaca qinghaiensis]|uniref:Manganese/zinc/iron transport system ATP-binding protein n=1 Tax=Sinobaca qinghaiensis TaxID=342944 RepID=A0A419V4C2_9BACL|nr:metal ABC transporter ATP-binding protein [Sinobaca qinghaiensis]RKD73281.1 manganese/zinc/iron transport system ATP- binding protein [Sinobaca qinghaiensis]
MSEAVRVENITAAYRKEPVLRNVSFALPQGRLIGIVGPNGAGKSTLLKAVLELIPKSSGNVEILGSSVRSQKKNIGYVPQRGNVDWDFPTNALDVVMMGRYAQIGWLKRPSKKDKALAVEALERVGMKEYADRQISQLSGGQQQRVFLARALIQDAQVYFMDEPFAGVDATTERAIIDLLKELKEKGKTVIVVHHDLQTVTEYFDWVLLLNQRLIACGPVEQTFTSELLQKTYGGRLSFIQQENLKI